MNGDTNSPTADVVLAAQWAAERCPVIDGIVFEDGRVKQVSATWKKQEDVSLEMAIDSGEWTTLEDLRRKGSLDWTGIIELCTAEEGY